MPPKPKRTREEVIEAAVTIVRKDGLDALTARALGSKLGVAPSSIFTHFNSMEEVESAVLAAIRTKYEGYVRRGLSMNPPFKGYGMEQLRFADEEPKLFSALFLERKGGSNLAQLLEEEGHRDLILRTISETFGISRDIAERVYSSLWVYLCGLATLMATKACSFTEEERSALLGNACRGFLLSAQAPADQRWDLPPSAGDSVVFKDKRYY